MKYNFENPLSPCVLELYSLRLGIFGDFSEFIGNPGKTSVARIGETLRDF